MCEHQFGCILVCGDPSSQQKIDSPVFFYPQGTHCIRVILIEKSLKLLIGHAAKLLYLAQFKILIFVKIRIILPAQPPSINSLWPKYQSDLASRTPFALRSLSCNQHIKKLWLLWFENCSFSMMSLQIVSSDNMYQ